MFALSRLEGERGDEEEEEKEEKEEKEEEEEVLAEAAAARGPTKTQFGNIRSQS